MTDMPIQPARQRRKPPTTEIGRGTVAMCSACLGSASPVWVLVLEVARPGLWYVVPLGSQARAMASSVEGQTDPIGQDRAPWSVTETSLTPLARLQESQLQALEKALALADFNAAMADLGRLVRDLTETELDDALNGAARWAQARHMLQVVPTGQALRELGFVDDPRGVGLVHAVSALFGDLPGFRLHLWHATHDELLGQWHTALYATSPRVYVQDERILPNVTARGQVAAVLLQSWRLLAHRPALTAPAVPRSLEMGLMWERHQRNMEAIGLHVPRYFVQGEAFRTFRRDLARLYRSGAQADLLGAPEQMPVHISSVAPDVLRLESACGVSACAGRGVWEGPVTLDLGDLLKIPAQALQGAWICLEQSFDSVWIGRHSITRLQ